MLAVKALYTPTLKSKDFGNYTVNVVNLIYFNLLIEYNTLIYIVYNQLIYESVYV